MRKKLIVKKYQLSYLGGFLVALSLLIKRFFGISNFSQFMQGFFISLGLLFIFVGFIRMWQKRSIS